MTDAPKDKPGQPQPSWKTLEERYLQPKPQRKLLALDGGGIRGVLTLEILLELENKLRQRLGKGPEFRLAHYFDYIGGTSTGAIIAAGLARGMSVTQLLTFYTGQGKAMFDKAWLLKKVKYFYKDGPLAKALEQTFGSGDISLASGDFLCLLLVVTMNRSTDSPWPISNNPFAKYNHPGRPDCNTQIKLYQLVRASTAAPIYFRPETLQWDANNPEKTFVFVDGGVTPYNNPSFLLYRMATNPAYKLCWETGERKLLLVSVGTGTSPTPGVYDNIGKALTSLPSNLMYAMQIDQDVNCRTVGRCTYGAVIDRELGDMIPSEPLSQDLGRHFLYARYNADISAEGLAAMGLSDIDADAVSELDSVGNINDLQRIGQTAAKTIDLAHFGSFV